MPAFFNKSIFIKKSLKGGEKVHKEIDHIGKKRFKMYKAGKKWLIAPIIFFGLLGLSITSTSQEVAAAETEAVTNFSADSIAEIVDLTNQAMSPLSDTEAIVVESQSTESLEFNHESKEDESTQAVSSEETLDPTVAESNSEQPDLENTPLNSNTNEVSNEQSVEKVPNNTNTSTQSAAKEATNTNDQPIEDLNKVTTVDTMDEISEPDPKVLGGTVDNAQPAEQIPVYRVYNPHSGEHFYTKDTNERDYLVSIGWQDEGIGSYSVTEGNELYRVYNPNSGEHHYTLSRGEIDALIIAGWQDEGIAWLTATDGLSVYRLFNPNARNAGSHHYTVDLNERNQLLKLGWKNEGIAYYSAGNRARIDKVLDWFYQRQDNVTYSMQNRKGPSSYDCSSAVFYALIESHYLPSDHRIGNTEDLFALIDILFVPITRDQVKKGSLFISGVQGSSGGASGHTGFATGNGTIIHCNYDDNGITETEIDGRTGSPVFWFDLKDIYSD